MMAEQCEHDRIPKAKQSASRLLATRQASWTKLVAGRPSEGKLLFHVLL